MFKKIIFILCFSFAAHAESVNSCSLFFEIGHKSELTKSERARQINANLQLDQKINPGVSKELIEESSQPLLDYNKYVHKPYYHGNMNPLSWSWYAASNLIRWGYMGYLGSPGAAFFRSSKEDALFYASPEIRNKMNQLEESIKSYTEKIVSKKAEMAEVQLDIEQLKEDITSENRQQILNLQNKNEKIKSELENLVTRQDKKKSDLEKLVNNDDFKKASGRVKRMIRQVNSYDDRLDEAIKMGMVAKYRALIYWKAVLKSRLLFWDKLAYTHLIFGKKNTSNGQFFEVIYPPTNREYTVTVTVPVYDKSKKEIKFIEDPFKSKWNLMHTARAELRNAFSYTRSKVPVLGWFVQNEIIKLERQQARSKGELVAVYMVLERLRLKGRLEEESIETTKQIEAALNSSQLRVSRRAKFWLNSQVFWAEHKEFWSRVSIDQINSFISKYFDRAGGADISKTDFNALMKEIGIQVRPRSSLPIKRLAQVGVSAILGSSVINYHDALLEYSKKSHEYVIENVMDMASKATGTSFKIAAITNKNYKSEKDYEKARNEEISRVFGLRYKKFIEGRYGELSDMEMIRYVSTINDFRKARAEYLLNQKIKSITKSRDRKLMSAQGELIEKLSEISFKEAEEVVNIAKIEDAEFFASEATDFVIKMTNKYDNNPELSKNNKIIVVDSLEIKKYIVDLFHSLKFAKEFDTAFWSRKMDGLGLGVRGSMALRGLIEDHLSFVEYRAKAFSLDSDYSIEIRLVESRKIELSLYYFKEYVRDYSEEAIEALNRSLQEKGEAYKEVLDDNPVLRKEIEAGYTEIENIPEPLKN